MLISPFLDNFVIVFFFLNTEPTFIDINTDGNTKDNNSDKNEESPLETSGNEEYYDEDEEIDEEEGDELNEHNIEFRQRRHLGTKLKKVENYYLFL